MYYHTDNNSDPGVCSVSSTEEKDSVQFSEPQKHDYHHQLSQQSGGDAARPRCPIYIYNCCIDLLKDQLLQQTFSRQPKDVFLRYTHTDETFVFAFGKLSLKDV